MLSTSYLLDIYNGTRHIEKISIKSKMAYFNLSNIVDCRM